MATRDEIAEAHERGYIEGSRRAFINQLSACLRGFYEEGDALDPLVKLARYEVERQEVLSVLRQAAERGWGDSDWPDDLYLPDVLDKHFFAGDPDDEEEESEDE